MRLVYIEWDDASDVDEATGWVDRETAAPAVAVIFKQVGFVTEETAEHIVLTCAYGDRQMAPRARIPIGMVRRRVELDVQLES